MNKSVAIIVGGTGQFGRILIKKLIKKNYKVVVTTRSLAKAKLKVKSNWYSTYSTIRYKTTDDSTLLTVQIAGLQPRRNQKF